MNILAIETSCDETRLRQGYGGQASAMDLFQ
jgi:hypothetical protein